MIGIYLSIIFAIADKTCFREVSNERNFYIYFFTCLNILFVLLHYVFIIRQLALREYKLRCKEYELQYREDHLGQLKK